ncbi:MAG: hypothetical protein KDD47_19625, partial [Acidobacteria bacterium]|nr:hypothetical protein [Acidobacteriota bacterium]
MLHFSEGVANYQLAVEVLDEINRQVHPEIEPFHGARTLSIRPASGWPSGTYTLRLLPSLADGQGNAWNRQLDLRFHVEGAKPAGTFAEVQDIRDVARLGSLLFLAADTAGLVVVDAREPGVLTNFVAPGAAFHLPFSDPVAGVDVDPHGRVVFVGGGVASPGQLKILDPLRLVPGDPSSLAAAFRGSTLISDRLSGPGTSLPEGTPRRVAVLSDDSRDRWFAGQAPPASAGVTVTAAAIPGSPEVEYTFTGALESGSAGKPVTVRDVTRGRWKRVDAASDGTFVLVLRARPGDQLELLRNRQSFAYVAILGAGITVVDLGSFYGENDSAADPDGNPTLSDVLGNYTGADDPALRLCNQGLGDFGGGLAGALIDLGTLYDPTGPHPLVAAGLVTFKGLVLLESNPADVGSMGFVNEVCADVGGSRRVQGMEVVEDYPFAFDRDGDGVFESVEERDYILVTHGSGQLLILDVTDRDEIRLVGRVFNLSSPARVSVDRRSRRAFVSSFGGVVQVVDFDRAPSLDPVDRDGNNVDDRILDTFTTDATGTSLTLLVPELGLAFAGGQGAGLKGFAVDRPLLSAVRAELAEGALDLPVSRLAPLGVPTAPESPEAGAAELPASFRLLAWLPGATADQLRLDVEALGPGGLPIDGAGSDAQLPGLPLPARSGADALTLERLAENPWEDGYLAYLSQEVVAVADLRAASAYTRSSKEQALCNRCDAAAAGVGSGAVEVLSGDTLAIRFSATARAQLEPIYGVNRLEKAELEIPSVRWDLSPSIRQEPTRNPSYGFGEVAPGTLLGSGEMSQAATDLMVRGRGLDFA